MSACRAHTAADDSDTGSPTRITMELAGEFAENADCHSFLSAKRKTIYCRYKSRRYSGLLFFSPVHIFMGMSDSTICTAAKASVAATLAQGQSSTIGDMSITNANLRDAQSIIAEEENKTARKSGRRPLFRSLDLSGVS